MGFIKLDRKMLDWEWYRDVNTKVVLLHCILKANWKEGSFLGVKIPRGSFATSVNNLAEEIGLTPRQTRTALDKLRLTNSVSIKRHSKFSVITVVEYDKYQTDDNQCVKQMTVERQTERQTECHEDDNNRRIIINQEKRKTLSRGESKKFVPPTIEEVDAYCQERQNGITGFEFCSFYESKGWMVGKNKMKSWKGAVRTWEAKRGFSYQPKKETPKNEGYEEVTLDDM